MISTSKVGPIRHAPWSKRFKTFYCHGQYAHEVQVGPLVFQWFYEKFDHSKFPGKRLHIWKDRFWHR